MKKKTSIKDYFQKPFLIFVILAFVALSAIVGLSLGFYYSKKYIFLQLITLLCCVFLLVALILQFHYLRSFYKFFYNSFYQITHENYQKILSREVTFRSYPKQDVDELKTLNEDIDKVNDSLRKTTVTSPCSDLSDLAISYLDKDKRIVEAENFHQLLPSILMRSQSYRNVLLFVYYEISADSSLSDPQLENMASILYRSFRDYPNFLLSPSRVKSGYYVYLPVIDNINAIYEKCQDLIKDLSLPIKDNNGSINSMPVHYALVCYPYSHMDEMFDDIHYAKRMGKVFSFYFPKRIKDISEGRLVHQTSLDLNTMSKILAHFNVVDEKKGYMETIQENMSEVLDAMDIDECGVIRYQELADSYESIFHIAREKDNEDRFKKGHIFDKNFILSLTKVTEKDDTYFASRRENCSYELTRFLDRFGIDSCFYHIIKDEKGRVYGIVYFDNIHREMPLNSYLIECLSAMTEKVGDLLINEIRRKTLQDEIQITEDILKISDCFLYKIQKNSHLLTYVSPGLNQINDSIKVGSKCYKAIYGLEAPCENCPLFTAKKMKNSINGFPVETSLTLNKDENDAHSVMLVKRMQKDDEFTDDLFDQNYLINSYYALMLQVKNAYLSNGKGYLLLLKIDNRNQLIQIYGNEKLTQALRVFLNKVRALKNVDNIYMDKPDTFAVLLMEYGQNDVINECETIYDLSRVPYFKDGDDLFEITYLPVSYPQGYPTHKDFLKHAEAFYFSGRYQSNQNLIYLDENGYTRPANKNEFMLSIIDQKFRNREFEVNLQPILNTSDKKITGAELLIRLSDDYRKIVFNTDELIKTAAKNNKISLITDALIDFISQLYKEYGTSVFKPYGFERLNINTDASYLSDPTLENKLKTLIEKNHLPPHFLGFEINEKEIYDHFDGMKSFFAMATGLKIDLICDRYSGEFISLDKLKELGINEFKIDRPYTRFIDTDKNKYVMVRDLLELAKRDHIHPSLIGVENMEQYKMIQEINPDSSLQGYAFFHPMDKNSFVETLRKNNTVIRAKK